MSECKISYPGPGGWDDIVQANCFKEGKHVKCYSNFNGDFNSIDIKKFCEEKAASGMYDAINVSCCDAN